MIDILVIGLGLSFYLAWKLSKRIVKPLNEMDLDHPDEKLVYEELAPLVKRLNLQQRQISIQRSDLQRKRDEFEAATSHMSEGIILLDETGSILSINASARRILKATPYCVGKDILLFNNTYELQDILQRARNGEHVEKPFATDAGSYQINVSPIFSGETVTGTVLLIFDITEKEKAEQMRREFTANVSHELKTPLHTIAGYAELLANNAVKPEDIPSFSQQILADARRMSALVDDIIADVLPPGLKLMRINEIDCIIIKTVWEDMLYIISVTLCLSIHVNVKHRRVPHADIDIRCKTCKEVEHIATGKLIQAETGYAVEGYIHFLQFPEGVSTSNNSTFSISHQMKNGSASPFSSSGKSSTMSLYRSNIVCVLSLSGWYDILLSKRAWKHPLRSSTSMLKLFFPNLLL